MRKLGKETSKIETKKDREFKQLCKEAKLTPLENDIIQLRKGITDGVKYNYTSISQIYNKPINTIVEIYKKGMKKIKSYEKEKKH
jgi:DNA-directed RNA polymerase sigma subunit (sigma70/sigma32)